MVGENTSNKDLFMVCFAPDVSAYQGIPNGYHIRSCHESEMDIWKELHVDEPAEREEYYLVLDAFYEKVYAPKGNLFFERCKVICNAEDIPVGTCFIWKSYDKINTLHWLKVKKGHENKGLGRAILTKVLADLSEQDYPVYLHTHPSSHRAIKLYSDFGFQLITDEMIGKRSNDYKECLPLLQQSMPQKDYSKLRTAKAPQYFLDLVDTRSFDEF